MCKIICEVNDEKVLNVAQDLEKHNDIKGISFKYNSRPGIFG